MLHDTSRLPPPIFTRKISPNPFRLLKEGISELTTVMAIEADNGLVVSSDLQRTGLYKEYAPKLRFFRNEGILGCAAGDASYIPLLHRHIIQTLEGAGTIRDIQAVLDKGIESFSDYLGKKIERQHLMNIYSPERLETWWPEGLYAAYDKTNPAFRIFTFRTPKLSRQEELFGRAAIGSGGDIALAFMFAAEELMSAANIERRWKRFSVQTIRQFSWLLLERISRIDPNSSGRDIEVITEDDKTYSIDAYHPVFKSGEYRLQIGEFVRSVFSDLDSPMPHYLAERFDLLEFFRSLRSRP